MTNIIGDWKTLELSTYVEGEGFVYKGEEYFASIGEEDMVKMFTVVSRFTEDNKCLALMPLPEGVTLEMVAEEGMEMVDGLLLIESKEWKEEDGKLWLDSGEHREVAGEVLSPFDEMIIEDRKSVV